jgi:C4-dicarboxylate-specific signal transduction histidine kinase
VGSAVSGQRWGIARDSMIVSMQHSARHRRIESKHPAKRGSVGPANRFWQGSLTGTWRLDESRRISLCAVFDFILANKRTRTPRSVIARMPKSATRWLASLWAALSILPSVCAVAGAAHTVVVLYSDDRFLPANIEGDRGLRAAIANAEGGRVELFDEHLDHAHFDGSPDYERTIYTYLHDKYASHAPEIIVAGGNDALDFVVRNRTRLFPQAPVVHMGVDRSFLQSIRNLSADVIGVAVENDSSGTIDQALRWHPLARRLVMVTGTAASDRDWEMQLRGEATRLNGRIAVEFLAGLPSATVMRRLAALGPNTIVFTPGFYGDGTGRIFIPRDTAEQMAAASTAPIYGPFSTFIGTGVVGGRMATYESMGRQAGAMVTALIAGTPPTAIHVPKVTPTDLHVDWRQVKRWGIDETQIPGAAIVHFRDPSLWDAHRKETIATGCAVLLLAGLSIRLLIERRSLKQTSDALMASEQRMSVAARAAKLAMWIWNVADDRIAVAPSQTAFDPTDHTSSQFPDALAEVHPDDREEMKKTVQESLAANHPFDLEYRSISPDGEVRWIAVRGRPHHDNHQQWLGIVLDVTDRKQAQLQAAQDRNALQHLSRVSMLGQLSASIAHQLNQPLTAILANAEAAQQMLRQEPVDLAEVKQICDDIVSQDQRAADVIRRLGALFKRGEMQIQQVDLNDLLSEALDLLHTNLNIDHIVVTTHLAEGLPLFDGDKIQLQQVLLNLIVNAADAMRDTPVVMRRLMIGTEATDTDIRLRVTDRGPGIAPENLKNIFEPFWSAKPAGMGIGLSICQSIVAAHHGTLTVANNPDGGATFFLVLPTVQAA